MSLTDTITETLRRLHEARNLHASLSERLNEAQALHDAEWGNEIQGRGASKAMVAMLELEVKALALAAYEATGNVSPASGVLVKLFDTQEYDGAKALEWAREKRMALTPECLDVKAFEKIAEATPLDFVTYSKTPKPTIATDLSKHLTEPPA